MGALSSVPMWVLVLLLGVVIVGVWFARNARAVKRVDGLPVWFCSVLVLAALVGMWLLLNAQFGGMVIGVRL